MVYVSDRCRVAQVLAFLIHAFVTAEVIRFND